MDFLDTLIVDHHYEKYEDYNVAVFVGKCFDKRSLLINIIMHKSLSTSVIRPWPFLEDVYEAEVITYIIF